MQVEKIGFQCPVNGVPCIAIYDNQAGVLILQVEDYDAFNSNYAREEIVEAFEWCNQNLSSCSNLSMANRHLSSLDISERFIEDGVFIK